MKKNVNIGYLVFLSFVAALEVFSLAMILL